MVDKIKESVKIVLLSQKKVGTEFEALILLNKTCANLKLNLVEKILPTLLGFCALIKYNAGSPVLTPDGKPLLYSIIRQNLTVIDSSEEN